MAAPIIAALRQQSNLRESVLHTAQELAHRASIYGVTQHTSLRYLAQKCHCCLQTIITHLKKLVALHIIRKQRCRVRDSAFFEINTYTFCLLWTRPPAQTGNAPLSDAKFPPPEEREKADSLGEKIRGLEKGLRWCTVGSQAYAATVEELARLRALTQRA